MMCPEGPGMEAVAEGIGSKLHLSIHCHLPEALCSQEKVKIQLLRTFLDLQFNPFQLTTQKRVKEWQEQEKIIVERKLEKMQQLEEGRQGRGAKEGRACRATEGSGKQDKCKQASMYPMWSGNKDLPWAVRLSPKFSSSSSAKPGYELWVPLGNRNCLLHHTKRKENPYSGSPRSMCAWMHIFWRSFFMRFLKLIMITNLGLNQNPHSYFLQTPIDPLLLVLTLARISGVCFQYILTLLHLILFSFTYLF